MTGTDTDTSKLAGTTRLKISTDQLAQMIEHVREWFPMEGCGLIAMRDDYVTRIYPGTNIANSPTFYEMDPRQVLDAMRDIDDRGDRLGAIFHSHPSTESWPSPTDLKLIFDPDVYMIIISLASEEPVVRAFQYDEDIREVPIVVSDSTHKGADV